MYSYITVNDYASYKRTCYKTISNTEGGAAAAVARREEAPLRGGRRRGRGRVRQALSILKQTINIKQNRICRNAQIIYNYIRWLYLFLRVDTCARPWEAAPPAAAPRPGNSNNDNSCLSSNDSNDNCNKHRK